MPYYLLRAHCPKHAHGMLAIYLVVTAKFVAAMLAAAVKTYVASESVSILVKFVYRLLEFAEKPKHPCLDEGVIHGCSITRAA